MNKNKSLLFFIISTIIFLIVLGLANYGVFADYSSTYEVYLSSQGNEGIISFFEHITGIYYFVGIAVVLCLSKYTRDFGISELIVIALCSMFSYLTVYLNKQITFFQQDIVLVISTSLLIFYHINDLIDSISIKISLIIAILLFIVMTTIGNIYFNSISNIDILLNVLLSIVIVTLSKYIFYIRNYYFM